MGGMYCAGEESIFNNNFKKIKSADSIVFPTCFKTYFPQAQKGAAVFLMPVQKHVYAIEQLKMSEGKCIEDPLDLKSYMDII